MADKRPAEFPTDWHYERHLEDLAREIKGWQVRVAELEALEDPSADEALAIAKSGLKASRASLKHYTEGQKTASKRPAGSAKKTRAKK